MNASDIISKLGGTTKAAALCHVTPGAVSQWLEKGIPQSRLMFLKLARPDVFEDAEAAEEVAHPSRRVGDKKT